jgi:DNA-binding response OmpR family regulator
MAKKILIVDDEVLILNGLSKFLSNDKIKIQTAATGFDALDEIRAYPYDLCFLDVNLPDISGLDVMKKIKEASPQTKVVIMTAHHVNEDMKKEIEDNAFHFIGKPFDLSQIKTVTELALGRGDGHRERSEAFEHASKKGRQFTRKQLVRTLEYFAGVFESGELKLLTLRGDIIDISDGGVGIKTDYNLKPGYMIRFSSEIIPQEVGIVKWCLPVSSDSYRAGIEFMKRA